MKIVQKQETASGKIVRLRVVQTSIRIVMLATVGALISACASPVEKTKTKKRSKEYFAESEYGVKASPRVAFGTGVPLPRGGGRDQTGKPYQVRGKWYYPKEEPGYKRVGRASWYGDAFHGRLTANGEVYDMRHLTAAHPTMPLPSYARVTNLANGSSVIVRVNDRGPYASDRVIDMSQRAAEMLDYTHHGTANVKVEYVGRAPLQGDDDAFLMASYSKGSDPIGQPATGVMIAMNGPTPTARATARSAIPNMPNMPNMIDGQPSPFGFEAGYDNQAMPINVPVPGHKPQSGFGLASTSGVRGLAGYADDHVARAQSSDIKAYGHVLTADAVSNAWRRSGASQPIDGEYVDLGLFQTRLDADRVARSLKALGNVTHVDVATEKGQLFGLTAVAINGNNDGLLRAAWKIGARDAFVVHAN